MMHDHRRNAALLFVVLIGTLSFSWVGLILSDDVLYADSARAWLEQPFPFIGHSHWSLRHTFVLPVAASFALFGENEWSLTGVTTVYFVLLLMVTYRLIADSFSPGAAVWSVIVLICTPLFAVNSTIAGADITELFFIILALYLFHQGTRHGPSPARLFAAGVALGLAFWTRETAVGALPLFVLLFLIGYRVPRRYYWISAAGFATMILAEWIFYWIATGDPFYRIMIDMGFKTTTVSPISLHLRDKGGTGNLYSSYSQLLDPILAILVNQEFGLLFYLLLPASIWIAWSKKLEATQRSLAAMMAGLALLWFLVISYVLTIRDLPRYYSVSAYATGVVAGLWLHHLFTHYARKSAIVLTAMLFGTFFLGLYVENKIPIFADRTYAQLTAQASETLHTDPMTFNRSRFLRHPQTATERASKEDTPPGGLYFYNPNRVDQSYVPGLTLQSAYYRKYTPSPDWLLVERIQPPRMWSGIVLEFLGMDQRLPEKVVKRLNFPVKSVAIYRLPKP